MSMAPFLTASLVLCVDIGVPLQNEPEQLATGIPRDTTAQRCAYGKIGLRHKSSYLFIVTAI